MGEAEEEVVENGSYGWWGREVRRVDDLKMRLRSVVGGSVANAHDIEEKEREDERLKYPCTFSNEEEVRGSGDELRRAYGGWSFRKR